MKPMFVYAASHPAMAATGSPLHSAKTTFLHKAGNRSESFSWNSWQSWLGYFIRENALKKGEERVIMGFNYLEGVRCVLELYSVVYRYKKASGQRVPSQTEGDRMC